MSFEILDGGDVLDGDTVQSVYAWISANSSRAREFAEAFASWQARKEQAARDAIAVAQAAQAEAQSVTQSAQASVAAANAAQQNAEQERDAAIAARQAIDTKLIALRETAAASAEEIGGMLTQFAGQVSARMAEHLAALFTQAEIEEIAARKKREDAIRMRAEADAILAEGRG